MGIAGTLLKEFKGSRKLIKVNELDGKCIAIDVSNELYRAVTGMKNVNLLTDKDGNITSHILVMLQNAVKFKNNNVKQIYVFDATPYEEKKQTLEKRQQIKQKAKDKMQTMIEQHENDQAQKETEVQNPEVSETFIIDDDDTTLDTTTLKIDLDQTDDSKESHNDIDQTCEFITSSKSFYTAEKMAFSPTKKMFDDIKFILDKLGIAWVQLDSNVCGEAEQYCAYLTKIGIADYVFTSDIDAFMFGATNVIRREQTERKDRLGNIKKGPNAFFAYNLNDMLAERNITYDNLISIGIALGTDFSLPIKGFGAKTAFKKVNTIKEKFDDSHRRTYEIFTTDCNYINTSIETNGDLTNIQILKDFLINEKNFNSDNVDKILN